MLVCSAITTFSMAHRWYSKFVLALLLLALILNQTALAITAEAETSSGLDKNDTHSYECPEGHLYYNETQSCQAINTKGPCGEMMKFVQYEDNGHFGNCACDNELDFNSNCTYRPKIYWPVGKRCYRAYDKGPCNDHEWLILQQTPTGQNDRALCALNPCPKVASDVITEDQFWFPFAGMCYLTGTQAFCRDPKYRAYILRYGITPVCLLNSSCPQPIADVEEDEPCKRNRRWAGRCRKKMTFSFPTNY